jgi:excisionase family DNA binding protein
MLQRLHTLGELQASLRVSMSTLRRAVRSGELEHVRAGRRGQIRVSEAALQAYLEKMSGRSKPPADVEIANAEGPGEHEEGQFVVHEGHVGKDATFRILNADVAQGLRSLPSESVHCAVTSPAYFWQRDYGVEGQMGHEATIEEYVQKLTDAFRELKRVLREDGVFFLNIGDAYYNAKGKPHGKDKKHAARQLARAKLRAVDGPGLGLPRKSLIGLPWRVALAMQATGWTLRSDVIWERPGCLGEPTAHDRPHRTYEHVFIFVKGVKYYFNRGALGDDEDIWSIPARPDNPYNHCAPFPKELVDRCLACGCPQNGVVLDIFLGSGTTAVSALRSGRSVIGIELNPDYCELARRRIEAEIRQLQLPENAAA